MQTVKHELIKAIELIETGQISVMNAKIDINIKEHIPPKAIERKRTSMHMNV